MDEKGKMGQFIFLVLIKFVHQSFRTFRMICLKSPAANIPILSPTRSWTPRRTAADTTWTCSCWFCSTSSRLPTTERGWGYLSQARNIWLGPGRSTFSLSDPAGGPGAAKTETSNRKQDLQIHNGTRIESIQSKTYQKVMMEFHIESRTSRTGLLNFHRNTGFKAKYQSIETV